MATAFDATNAPFDRLTPQQIGAVEAALDIGYFRPGETLIARDGAPDSLFVVIKGCVEERDGDEVVGLRGPGDCFDSRALVQGGGVERLRRARGDAVQPRAARPHPASSSATTTASPPSSIARSRASSKRRRATRRRRASARCSARGCATSPLPSRRLRRAERDDRERRRDDARDQDQRRVRARRRARRPADRHEPRQSGDPRAPADRDERRRPGEIRHRHGRGRRFRLARAAAG